MQKNHRVGLPEVNLKNESKYQPAKLSQRDRDGQKDANEMGHAHDFNEKAKVTKTSDSCYHDVGQDSGCHGNFEQKDASIDYLRERGKKGIEVSRYSGNKRYDRNHTGTIGQTVYPSSPLNQVYERATSDMPESGRMKPDYDYGEVKDRTERKGNNLER